MTGKSIFVIFFLYLITGCVTQKEISGKIDIPNSIFEYTAEGNGIPCVAFTGSENLGHRLYSEKFRNKFLLIHADPSQLDSTMVSTLTVDMILDDIEKVRKALNLPQIAVIGHSMFGTLPLDYALKYPQKISYSISTGSKPSRAKKYKDIIKDYWETNASDERKEVYTKNMEEFSKLNMNKLTPTQKFVKYYTANIPRFCFDLQFDMSEFWGDTEINMDFLDHFRKELSTYDNSAKYKTISTPVLVISGRHDYSAPYVLWGEIKNENPSLTFHVFDNSGHNPSIEIPEQFDDFVIQWLYRN
ncbi:MAG: alpha/beta fold hydrolase [Calditrichaeota bacterium]|nr:MAG: alpha/beta fold hydrolase [Calditrichota bacterium]MBL1206486.1 alpha/beta fold hydrolase [Calditrichota bacterium]NOG46313.1 alpha/beta fold hydrolase [Calditrichota bacterium]